MTDVSTVVALFSNSPNDSEPAISFLDVLVQCPHCVVGSVCALSMFGKHACLLFAVHACVCCFLRMCLLFAEHVFVVF